MNVASHLTGKVRVRVTLGMSAGSCRGVSSARARLPLGCAFPLPRVPRATSAYMGAIGAIWCQIVAPHWSVVAAQSHDLSNSGRVRSPAVSLELVASLAAPAVAPSFSPHVQVRRNSRGDFIVGPTRDGRRLLVYRRATKAPELIDGSEVAGGPFRTIETIALDASDSLFVFDAGQTTAAVFGPDFRYVRQMRLPGRVHEGAVLPDGHIVLHAIIRTASLFGLALHVVTKDGQLIRSFDEEVRAVRPSDFRPLYRLVTVSGNSILSIARYGECRITTWGLDGSQQGSYECSSLGSLGVGASGPGEDLVRPPTEVRAIVPGRNGDAWILFTVPKQGWSPRATQDTSGHAHTLLDRAALHEYLDSVLLRISKARPSAVDQGSRLRGAFLGQAGEDLVFSRRRTQDGTECLDIWRIVEGGPAARKVAITGTNC